MLFQFWWHFKESLQDPNQMFLKIPTAIGECLILNNTLAEWPLKKITNIFVWCTEGMDLIEQFLVNGVYYFYINVTLSESGTLLR